MLNLIKKNIYLSHIFLPVLIVSVLPLFTKAGRNFEYESTLIITCLFLAIYPLWAFLLSEKTVEKIKNAKKNNFLLLSSFAVLLFFTGLNSLFYYLVSCKCSYPAWTMWTVINTYPSLILSLSLFFLLVKLREKKFSKKKALLILFFIYFLIIGYDLTLLWIHPQKRIISFFLGFLHGPLYDQWIEVDLGVFWTRLGHFLIAVSFLYLFLEESIKAKKILFVFFFSFSLSLYTFSQAKNYSSTQHSLKDLQKNFSNLHEEKSFTLYHHQNEAKKSLSEAEIFRLKEEISFHIYEIKKMVNIFDLPHVHIFIYPDSYSKKMWFGANQTDVADVYTPSIHLSLSRWPSSSLRHELVHALLSKKAFFGLGFHPNMAFTEGLAVALAPEGKSLSLHQAAAHLIKKGLELNIESIFNPWFWFKSQKRTYTLAGSFILYLSEHYSLFSVLRLYLGEDIKKVFNLPLKNITSSWKSHVLSLLKDDHYDLYLNKLFLKPGIIYEDCPHSQYDLHPDFDNKNFIFLRRPISWNAKKDYLAWKKSLTDKRDEVKIREVIGKVKSSYQRNHLNPNYKVGKLIQKLRKHLKKPYQSIEDVQIELFIHDLLFLSKAPEAKKILASLKEFSNKKYIGRRLLRHIFIRDLLIGKISYSQASQWISYLASFRKIPKTYSYIWALKYLKFLSAENPFQTKKELTFLLKENPPFKVHQEILLKFYKTLAKSFIERKLWKEAKNALEKATKYASQGEQALLKERMRLFSWLYIREQKRKVSGDY